MAIIRPFSAVQYNSSQVNLEEVTFTQGDSIQKDLSPYHIKQILEPKLPSNARSKFIKYAQSSALLNEWKRQNIFFIEKEPAYYLYEQRFTDYLNQERVRTNLICLLKIEDYGTGKIHPHEQVISSNIEDRIRLLESTYTHFEPIMGLYNDADSQIKQVLAAAHKNLEIVSSIKCSDGVRHCIYKIKNSLDSIFQDKDIWIADGHHRYEAALKLKSSLTSRKKEKPTDYILANLVSLQDPGLCVYPLHLIYSVPENKMWETFSQYELIQCDPNEFKNLFSEKKHQNSKEVGIIFPTKGYFILSNLKESIHKILKHLPLPADYLYHYDELVKGVDQGATAVFMPYLSSTHLLDSIIKKKQMAPKSTCFIPKLRSGLLFWSMGDENSF